MVLFLCCCCSVSEAILTQLNHMKNFGLILVMLVCYGVWPGLAQFLQSVHSIMVVAALITKAAGSARLLFGLVLVGFNVIFLDRSFFEGYAQVPFGSATFSDSGGSDQVYKLTHGLAAAFDSILCLAYYLSHSDSVRKKAERDKEWDLHFRTLSSMARDSNFASDPASDPSPLNSVKKLHELCKAENSEDLIARIYPQLNKIFQRSVASISQSRTSNGLLLLAILQFFLDFGEVVLHDADPSEYLLSFLLEPFFPLMLKLIAWNGDK
ncbi:hypothetical protein RHMOL_Rhmol09G0026000 [Rhododendron molle]|uniref:Uncharacterized protein n=1 Tax=Rhododendron molle TaxID=49168 RepID=A0ACC0MAN5_RHOML|nr:hypothetical protein RHMOL_Rhmol09G0026000 [Rhododendron molle]